jgi:heptosyltransferase-1
LKILLVRVSSLGDVLHNLPMVADILRHHPGREDRLGGGRGLCQPGAPESARAQGDPVRAAALAQGLGKAVRAEIKASSATCAPEAIRLRVRHPGPAQDRHHHGRARVRPGGQQGRPGQRQRGFRLRGHLAHLPHRSIPLDPRTHAVARGRRSPPRRSAMPSTRRPISACRARPANASGLDAGRAYAVFFHGTARDAKKWAPATGSRWDALAPMPILLPWGSPKEKARGRAFWPPALPNARVLPKLSMMDAVSWRATRRWRSASTPA